MQLSHLHVTLTKLGKRIIVITSGCAPRSIVHPKVVRREVVRPEVIRPEVVHPEVVRPEVVLRDKLDIYVLSRTCSKLDSMVSSGACPKLDNMVLSGICIQLHGHPDISETVVGWHGLHK